jgi:hypothetical protein
MLQRTVRRYRCNHSADECRRQATSGGCQQITDHRRRLQQTPSAVATPFGADVEAVSLPRRESRRRCGAALHAPHRPSLRLCDSGVDRPVAAATARAACTCVCVCAPRARAMPSALLRPPMTAAAAPPEAETVGYGARACVRAFRVRRFTRNAQRADFGSATSVVRVECARVEAARAFTRAALAPH